jgi:transposase InsO family protein
VEEEPDQQPGLSRRGSDQRRLRDPRRRPDLRVRVHRRRTARQGHQRRGNRVARCPASSGSGRCTPTNAGGTATPASRCTTTVERRFVAERPDQTWLTDITEDPTGDRKLYLCAIRDVCSGRIIGYSMDSRMKAALDVSALRNAIALRSPIGTTVDSDRGSQFRLNAFVRALKSINSSARWARTGACGDHGPMESFFALLQKNVLNRKRRQTRDDLRPAITTWIERTYHRRRRQRRLGKLTPIELECYSRRSHKRPEPPTRRVD